MAEGKTWLDRALSVVTDVRAGEGFGALILAANIFSGLARNCRNDRPRAPEADAG
jgi:hypothetical protein